MRTVKGFGDRLSEVVAECGRLCVGIDLHPGLLDAWQLPRLADGLERSATTCVKASGGIITVVKSQATFFEAYGSKGFVVLERTSADLKDAGALSIVDAKHGDIGPVMVAYTEAWLSDGSPLAAGALTVSSYFGFGALDPTISLALENGRGLFVLATTFNPGGTSMRETTVSGEGLIQAMVGEVATINARWIAAGAKAGSIGVVIDTTLDDAPVLSGPRGPILMPNVGAQGGTLADIDRLAGESRGLTLSNISCTILSTGPDSVALRRTALEAAAPFLDKS